MRRHSQILPFESERALPLRRVSEGFVPCTLRLYAGKPPVETNVVCIHYCCCALRPNGDIPFIFLGSKAKQSRKEKEAELAEVIEELAMQVDIKGSCRKPTWRDQPVVLLAQLPIYTGT